MRNCGETIFITVHDIESRLCGVKNDKNQEKAWLNKSTFFSISIAFIKYNNNRARKTMLLIKGEI